MKMKRYIIACLLAGSGALMTSCGDYLDIVPDNVISLEEIFKTRKGVISSTGSEAEMHL